ncbi:vacuolar protein sorting-associated protein 41 homolog [Argopecten irradians]|uniref:vacuolar protein sorting-associated protein 41 homolog n=1 Tax=Argopecten irradians TaxID=31199 RepID=UPI00370FA7AD
MATSTPSQETVEDDDQDESDEESSEEEVEPKLKYERLGNDLNTILSKDCASCMAVDSKFLAVGTHWGMIYILDYIGFNINSKEVASHSTTVNQISLDDNGDFMASCSDDGRVMITGLYTQENNQTLNFDRPVKAVAMDPNFYKHGSGRQFVTGDDKLVLNEKGFLSRHKTTVLHQGEGPIREIKWKGSFIAWANDMGVKVYDMNSRSRITFIPKGHDQRADLHRCSICWKDSRTFLIAWADRVKVCVVRDRMQQDVRDLPNRYVEITAMFTVDSYVCGIAPLGEELVLLTYEKDLHKEGDRLVAQRPHLQVVKPSLNDYEEVSNDALSIRGFQEYKCNDYHLESLREENLFYIVSPRDVIASRLCDMDDHITWLLDHDLFEEAMEATQTHEQELRKHTPQRVGRQYLVYLLEEQQYDQAAQLCVKILRKDKDAGRKLSTSKIHHSKAIAPYLPRGDPQLGQAIYEMVLNEFLLTDEETYLKMVKEWPSYLYNVKTLISSTLERLDSNRGNKTLLQALGELYSFERSFDKALAIYIKLRHKDVFSLIYKHDLFDSITDKIIQLMEFDCEQAVDMLIGNMKKMSIDNVVQQLEKTPHNLYVYLDKVFQKDPQLCQKYHGKQVRLYAEFDRPRLLSFLRSSNHYPLQMALEECEMRDFIPEQVFLLGRMGNVKQALELITSRLQDVNQAIEFCKDQNEQELWEDLIQYSIDKPSFIKGLLQNIGTHVDPIILITKIQEGMHIPGLRDSLVKILQDYNLQMSLREGCKRILVADSFNLMDRLVKTHKRGISVNSIQTCHTCQQAIIVSDLRYASNAVIFFCRHVFHEDCLPAHSMESCPICSSTQKRGPGAKGLGT